MEMVTKIELKEVLSEYSKETDKKIQVALDNLSEQKTHCLKTSGDMYTNQELMRRDLGEIKETTNEIKDAIKELKTEFVSKVEFENTKEKVKEIRSKITWVTRLVIGAVIMAILALILNK